VDRDRPVAGELDFVTESGKQLKPTFKAVRGNQIVMYG